MKKLRKFTIVFALLLMCLCLFTGCEGVKSAYLDSSLIEYAQCDYDVTTNTTEVVWKTTLTNNAIYDIDSFSVEFKMYKGDIYEGTRTFTYSRFIKHGDSHTGNFRFEVDGEFDSVEFKFWMANYASFWDTYKIWIIVMSVLAGVGALVYITFMIIEDLEFEELFEFLGEHFLFTAVALGAIALGLIGLVIKYWVSCLIVLGGFVAFIILILIAHFIKYIIESI